MSTERLKHASEVLGWLAEGKLLQVSTEASGVWADISGSSKDREGIAKSLWEMIGQGWRFRIKAEPVKVQCSVVEINSHGDMVLVIPVGVPFRRGDTVTVTKMEDEV